MRVLVACESSGRVREAFRALGHDAYSCDVTDSEDDSPYHIKDDVLSRLVQWEPWDLMIAHPPCTYLCNSGVRWLKDPKPEEGMDYEDWVESLEFQKVAQRWNDLQNARQFFLTLWNAPIPKICLENPVPHKHGRLPPYSQTIQPYQFGDDASKRTCLWLKGLSPLQAPSKDLWVKPRMIDGKPRWSNQTDSGQNKLGPSKTRASERSRTYQGIADAFAKQWG